MIAYRFVATAFALVFMAGYSGTQKSMAAPAPEPAAYGQERWEIPPGEFNEIQRRGFHDGIEGARKDYGNHRKPNVDNREEYRHSNMPRECPRGLSAGIPPRLRAGRFAPVGRAQAAAGRRRLPSFRLLTRIGTTRTGTIRTGTAGACAAWTMTPGAAVIAKAWKKPGTMSSSTATPIPTTSRSSATRPCRRPWPMNTARASCAATKWPFRS